MVIIQHANPYYDDSYAVNSENVGPYGDAINQELLPYLEKRFRGIGQGWARGHVRRLDRRLGDARDADLLPGRLQRRVGRLPGCGGLSRVRGHQHLRREERVLHQQRLEEDAAPGRSQTTSATSSRSPRRTCTGSTCSATNGRSGDQWDIWQAVYSPVGKDGYPRPIWDPMTGVIDHQVADVLARALRPALHRRARLGDTRPEAAGEAPHLRRRRWTRGT